VGADESTPERWLTIGQTHQRLAELGITEQTVRAWADAGRHGLVVRRLPGSKHRRVAESSVEALLQRWNAGEAVE
jgi:hypothetical protein